ncbi:MAG: 2-amino-4-hydroxy-6-hydroxymethyldihydropteridine diphosphokinase [Burkholderiales bacterium]
METAYIAYVALGSNLQEPQRQLRSGFAALARLPESQLIAQSSLVRSAPVGYANQPDFVNAVAAIRTALTPRALLDALLAIEREHGRVREFANAPRTLDLDILLYGERVIDEAGLSVPHPRMHERAFVMVPLAEIAPDAMVPGRGRARDLLAGVDCGSVSVLKAVAA